MCLPNDTTETTELSTWLTASLDGPLGQAGTVPVTMAGPTRPRGGQGQGCGVGVEIGVGVGRSRPFWPEFESELESVKFGRLRLLRGVASYHPSIDDDFGRTAIHPSENIGRLEGKENSSA